MSRHTPIRPIDAPERVPTVKDLNAFNRAYDQWCERRGIKTMPSRKYFRRLRFGAQLKPKTHN